MPRFNSDAEKAAWIANHPDDYERMTGEKVTNVIPEFKTQAEKDAWIQQITPKKEVEGNKSLNGQSVQDNRPVPEMDRNSNFDEKSYIESKENWIKANPEVYERIIKQ